jgi:protein ImuB
MQIPSYDDLTPSIPDITPRETFDEIAKFFPRADPSSKVTPSPTDALAPSSFFYACLRDSRIAGSRPSTSSGRPERAEGRIPDNALRQAQGVPSLSRDGSRLPEAPRTAAPHASPHFLIARDFSPRIERHGDACVVLDISGLGRLLGTPHAIGTELARAAEAYAAHVRIAIARSHTAARLLSIAHPGPTIADGDVAAAIALLPLETLRVVIEDDDGRGAGAAARLKATIDRLETFRRWGLTTLGDIAALPSMELSERMGQEGVALQQFARGIDRAPLVPDPDVPRFLQSMELDWPIDALEPLSFVFARLLDPLSFALERADRGAAALRLDLRLVDRTTHSRVLQLPAAMRDAKVLRTLLLLDLESHPPSAAIDVVTIEIDPVPGRIVQYSLLERALPSPETLATLTARLGALVGDSRCGSPVPLDTWRPDGFEMTRFAPDHSRPSLRVAPSEGRLAEAAEPRRRTRSEQRGASCAERAASNLILRRFRPPIAIRVTSDRGRPGYVAIDRRGMPGGHVERAAGPWRTSGAWWDPKSAAWDRDEWDVALSDGSICRLVYDRITECWFLEAILD